MATDTALPLFDAPPVTSLPDSAALDALALPHVTFNASLRMLSYNKLARVLFSPPEEPHHVDWLLSRNKHTCVSELGHIQREIAFLAELSSQRASDFGAGVTIACWTGSWLARTQQNYMVVVKAFGQSATETKSVNSEATAAHYTILFLRLATITPATSSAVPESTVAAPTMAALYNSLTELGRPEPLPPAELQQVISSLDQIVFVTDPAGGVRYFNDQFYIFTGLSEAEALESPAAFFSIFHHDDLKASHAAWAEALATGTPLKTEYRLRDSKGKYRWLATRGNPIRDANGEIQSWVLTSTELDDLMNARSDAVKVREQISAILYGARFCLFSVDLLSFVTFFEGPASAAMPPTHATASLIGSSLADAWPDPVLHAAVKEMIHSSTSSAPHCCVESTVASGSAAGRVFRYQLVPLLEKEGEVKGVIIVSTEVTTLVAAGLERAALIASEVAANLASQLKTQFVTQMSHEIRSPIASMLGIGELLLDDPTLNEEQRDLIERSVRCGDQLLELVGMVLDVGKIEANELHVEHIPFLLAEVIDDAFLFSIASRQKNVEFKTEISPGVNDLTLLGDRIRVRQVITNILSNAADSPDQTLLQFEVEDTGCGIEAAVIPLLFKPFQQADTSTARKYGGSGLGLIIAKNLVDLMGGHVKLSSTFGVGTKMTVVLPFEKAPDSFHSLVNYSPVRLPSFEGMGVARRIQHCEVNILVAEDNELIREIITRTLRKMSFRVSAVVDGSKIMAELERDRYDLLLTDGQMPILDGYSATRLIRQSPIARIRNIRIIALTASAVKGDHERCIEAGMDAYLSKPVRSAVLEAAIWAQLSPSLVV